MPGPVGWREPFVSGSKKLSCLSAPPPPPFPKSAESLAGNFEREGQAGLLCPQRLLQPLPPFILMPRKGQVALTSLPEGRGGSGPPAPRCPRQCLQKGWHSWHCMELLHHQSRQAWQVLTSDRVCLKSYVRSEISPAVGGGREGSSHLPPPGLQQPSKGHISFSLRQ